MPALPPSVAEPKRSLLACDAAGLATAARSVGEDETRAPLRGRQLFHWIHRRGATSFAAMTTLPAGLRAALDARFTLARPEASADRTAADGTRKWLLRLADGREVETVLIPEAGRTSLCISTQVGCTLTCAFCHTGTMPLVRNLTDEEIIGQVLHAKDALDDWGDLERRRLTNIVVMGMGEPLYNYENVKAALRLVMDAAGLDLSRRRITLSTSGVVPKIEPCGVELGVGLAVSLHAVRDELRDRLVPLNRKWPIATLLDACRRYPTGRTVTFEYVMLKDVNDSDADARELVRLLGGIDAKVNLIPFNPWPGTSFECSRPARIGAFAAIVEAAGYESPVRTPRGRDILAACGQLKTASERLRRVAA